MANFNIDYLVVAGGGGGGPGFQGGGGGAGGLRTSYGTSSGGGSSNENKLTLTSSIYYTVTVGDGGAGGAAISADSTEKGDNGDNSVFHTITSLGGGGGASYYNVPSSGLPGGSGGGAGNRYANPNQSGGAGTASQGYAGGNTTTYLSPYSGGGGGGAASAGVDGGASGALGYGGNGLEVNIVGGTGNYYAGGGGAGVYSNGSIPTGGSGGGGDGSRGGYSNATTPGVGLNELGGGGGAGGSSNYAGADGGSGIVILRYATADAASYASTGLTPTETTDGTDTILSFTTVGTGSITFTAPTPPPPTFDGTKVTTPVTGFQSGVDVGLKIPIGTNSNVPTGVEGMIRNDTEENGGGTNSTTAITFYNGTDWKYFTSTESPYSPPIENFNTVLYTGSGSSGTNAITGVGFQPDLVWIKNRSAGDPAFFDTLRNDNKTLFTNLTLAESTLTGGSVSMDTDGFNINTYGATFANANGQSYVAWCWKAGGTAVTNNDGSIASQVSVNNNLGFSIVKTTGTSGTINFGHGLDTAPEMIINKGLTSNGWSWLVYHKDIGTGKYLKLNSIDAETSNAGSFSSVTSTTITNNSSNGSSDYINYCFTSKPGLSKVGSYVGTGAGTSVTTGFEPAFVMIKKTSGPAAWIIFNNKTGSNILKPNTSAAEVPLTNYITYDSTGFTFPTGDSNINSGNFIYLAFAT